MQRGGWRGGIFLNAERKFILFSEKILLQSGGERGSGDHKNDEFSLRHMQTIANPLKNQGYSPGYGQSDD